jgi:hypothetical protein
MIGVFYPILGIGRNILGMIALNSPIFFNSLFAIRMAKALAQVRQVDILIP